MRLDRIEQSRLEVFEVDEAATEWIGHAFARILEPGDLVALTGTLGAGKTRLSRAIAEASGVDPLAITSPTFILIHEYEGAHFPIYHFDTYRLESPSTFDALGASDYWTSGSGVCLVEWADRVADRLPDTAWWVQIALTTNPGERAIEIRHLDPKRLDQLECSVRAGSHP